MEQYLCGLISHGIYWCFPKPFVNEEEGEEEISNEMAVCCMYEEKWETITPFSPEDLRLYDALVLAIDIEKCYEKYGVSIKIKKKGYNPCCGDGFKFLVKLKGETRLKKITDLIPTIQVKLGIPHFNAVSENGVLYFTTFEPFSVPLNNNLQHIMGSSQYKIAFEDMEIAHPVGVTLDGKIIIRDLAKYPHAMISGTTRSGKSTALKCLLVSLLRYAPSEINLLIADRGAELFRFEGIPHLSYPVIGSPECLAYVIMCLKEEMERRNVLRREDNQTYSNLPYIIFAIDEFSWFIDEISQIKKIDKAIKSLNDILRFGRNSKIHLVLSIHDPKDDIAIIEKGDIPVGLIFQTVNARKSMNAFGNAGAEKLKGNGEMYFHQSGQTLFAQGVYIDDDNIEAIIQTVKSSGSVSKSPIDDLRFAISDETIQRIKEDITTHTSFFSLTSETERNKDDRNRKFAEVVLWVLAKESVSINLIQHECAVSNNYAKDFFNELQDFGIVGESAEKGRRKVCPLSSADVAEDLKKFLINYKISDEDIERAIAKRTT